MNVLVIMSDEHSNEVMGTSGHPIVQTPALDQLASEGSSFTNCYTNSPLCTPARASFFTGQYVNKLGTWDNATPYDGKVQGMSQYLNQYGHEIRSFGKWDFHPDGEYAGLDATMPLHRANPQLESCFREEAIDLENENRFKKIGITEKESFDENVRDLALDWLKNKRKGDEPWVLYVGFIDPHFPFHVKQQYWDQYDPVVTDIPDVAKGPFPELNSPLLEMQRFFKGSIPDEETIRKIHAGYYAKVSQLDDNIGQILNVLKEQDLEEETLIVYTSDHGEQLGHHGLWWKCCMFEESAHVPLIMKGPGIKENQEINTLVSLVDIFPTLCDAVKIPVPEQVPGRSLLNLASGKRDIQRNDFVFSEYHAHGMPVGMYMIRWQYWKYVYFVGYSPQLFNLKEDPHETKDLAELSRDDIKKVLSECERRLRLICDPEEVDKRAKSFQGKLRDNLGLTKFERRHAYVPHPEYINDME